MLKTRAATVAGVVVVVLIGGGVAAAMTGGDSDQKPPQQTHQQLSEDQQKVFRSIEEDSPIGVIDRDGKPRGFISHSEQVARDRRVLDRIIESGFPEPKGPDDPEYNSLFSALTTLDPVAVVDDDGTVVGYWNLQFITIDQQEAAVPEARATVARLIGE